MMMMMITIIIIWQQDNVLDRLHITHSYLMHSFILRKRRGLCLNYVWYCNHNQTYRDWMCWFSAGYKKMVWGQFFIFTFSEYLSSWKQFFTFCEKLVYTIKYEMCEVFWQKVVVLILMRILICVVGTTKVM